MALASLCEESEWGLTWRDVMQHRLDSSGPLEGHALGNLLITGLWQLLGDTVEGLDWVGRLLGAQGRVLPMAAVPLDIEAQMRQGDTLRTVRGQSHVAKAPGVVEHVRLSAGKSSASIKMSLMPFTTPIGSSSALGHGTRQSCHT